MAKYYGKIGFGTSIEVKPGVWEDHIKERPVYGDILQNYIRNESAQQVNENINISNRFSIVSDTYALENLNSIKYLTYLGTKWKVSSIDIQYPRLILTVGGVYNVDKT